MSSKTAVVVGAGPVGCLAALMLANRGWTVKILEARPARQQTQQRSINLAISHRGLEALKAVDPNAATRFLDSAIPMKGRMIHSVEGALDSQLYDKDGQCINSIDRSVLNQGLLEDVEACPAIQVLFEHKVQAIDFEKKTIRAGLGPEFMFDLCIGADGSYSAVRREMMKVVRMDFSQEYIPDEYIELKIPAGHDHTGQPTFALDPNHLHIWPRHSFMLIALPNKDRSFTCTLFAPRRDLDDLLAPAAHGKNGEKMVAWFQTHFPDAFPIIGEKNFIRDVTQNPRSPLICTRSNPYHYKGRAILLGDAAHSMVPFYGQGLNCGLEDVRILDVLLGEQEDTEAGLQAALTKYSETRHEDLLAICDLAMQNYVEMRHLVTSPLFLFKKWLDTTLYALSSSLGVAAATANQLTPYAPVEPKGWLPLYTMVTFRPDINYATVKRKAAFQNSILTAVGWASIGSVAAVAIWGLGYARKLLP